MDDLSSIAHTKWECKYQWALTPGSGLLLRAACDTRPEAQQDRQQQRGQGMLSLPSPGVGHLSKSIDRSRQVALQMVLHAAVPPL